MLPAAGVPMLGNDRAGCCVFATFMHYLQVLAEYTHVKLPHGPTEQECISAYSAVTGYDPRIPSSDQGTYYAGQGGAFDYWIKHGIICGGKLNKLTDIVVLDQNNQIAMKDALNIGPVMFGAMMSESDVDSAFMWDDHQGPILGGHAFLGLGYETLLSGKTYWDMVTWNGSWRATDTWIAQAVDEAYLPLNLAFFNAQGLNPAALNFAQITAAMRVVRAG